MSVAVEDGDGDRAGVAEQHLLPGWWPHSSQASSSSEQWDGLTSRHITSHLTKNHGQSSALRSSKQIIKSCLTCCNASWHAKYIVRSPRRENKRLLFIIFPSDQEQIVNDKKIGGGQYQYYILFLSIGQFLSFIGHTVLDHCLGWLPIQLFHFVYRQV